MSMEIKKKDKKKRKKKASLSFLPCSEQTSLSGAEVARGEVLAYVTVHH